MSDPIPQASPADSELEAPKVDVGADTQVVGEAASADAPSATSATAETSSAAEAATPAAAPAADQPADAGGEAAPVQQIDAMICVPGIGESAGTTFMDVAARIATAMERCAESGRAVFSVATRDATTRQGKTLHSVAICRADDPKAKAREVLHLYEYDYHPVLDDGLKDRAPAAQAVAMGWTLAFSFPSVWWALVKRRSKGWAQKLQVVYGTMLFCGILFYMLLLVIGTGAAVSRTANPPASTYAATSAAASAASAQQAPAMSPLPANAPALPRVAPPKPAWYQSAWSWTRATAVAFWAWLGGAVLWLAGMVVVIPLAGTFVRFNIREVLAKAAPSVTAATGYVSAGQHRSEIVGGLGEMLEYLEEDGNSGVGYRKVHMAAYSFGTLVALDALFQNDGDVARRFGRICTLVTIGCPYDFVRTYWPSYFQNRYAAPAARRPRWINIYSPLDVLGSNFIDEPTRRERGKFHAAASDGRHDMLRTWDARYQSGIDLLNGEQIRPAFDDNVAFGPGQGGTASLGSWLRFVGFRAHGFYWSRESASAVNCFEPVITRLYAADDALKVLA